MKRAFLAFVLFCIIIIPSFAKEGDVHVTRTTTAVFNLDAGAGVIMGSDDNKTKTFGVFGAVTFTPASFSKVNAGIKAEVSLNGFKGEDSKKLGISGLLVIRAYIRKSFEVYGGVGARYLIWDIISLTDFSHGWGIVAQGGARGRLRNWLGVGVQFAYLKGFDTIANQLEITLYGSIEL
jgi:hypothetical protein